MQGSCRGTNEEGVRIGYPSSLLTICSFFLIERLDFPSIKMRKRPHTRATRICLVSVFHVKNTAKSRHGFHSLMSVCWGCCYTNGISLWFCCAKRFLASLRFLSEIQKVKHTPDASSLSVSFTRRIFYGMSVKMLHRIIFIPVVSFFSRELSNVLISSWRYLSLSCSLTIL